MAEYITKEEALNAVEDAMELTSSEYDMIAEKIDNVPAADVAPVVRCRDCKWFANNNDDEWFGCWLFNAIRAVPEDAPTPDDFCSYGERKDDNAT